MVEKGGKDAIKELIGVKGVMIVGIGIRFELNVRPTARGKLNLQRESPPPLSAFWSSHWLIYIERICYCLHCTQLVVEVYED